ncbi:MAG: hypothetical protein KF841_08755 [Phycisphaerae bacterium]|nr:hypothetical protein [Phycisphaerae bacterium]
MAHVVECPVCSMAVSTEHVTIDRTVECPHCETRIPLPLNGVARNVTEPGESTRNPDASAIRFYFQCLRCGTPMESVSQFCGKPGRCPTCGVVFIIPDVDSRTGAATHPPIYPHDNRPHSPLHAYASAGGHAPKLIRLENGEHEIECPRCRRRSRVDANICDTCATPFTLDSASAFAGFQPSRSNSCAYAALLVGFASLPTFHLPILGVIAIGLGWIALRRSARRASRAGRSSSITGVICGSIAILLAVLRHLP